MNTKTNYKMRRNAFLILINNNLLLFIICLSSVFTCCLANNKDNVNNVCNSKTNCSDCIEQAECVWCITQNTLDTHCLHKNDKKLCETNKIENPISEAIVTSEDPSSILTPTKINLKIRSNQPVTINFTFTQPKNVSVDLYFLMDISYTMRQHRDKLASLASDIVTTLKNFTPDVRMGFGSFVDKPISPFAYTENGQVINPCADLGCNIPYSFKNHLSLTNDINEFSLEVNTTKPSGNVDMPEGSLEALMQAIVCKNEIGWRKNARRLIVLSTDTTFHIAGDGKLAGIDKPNDGLCHLQNNIYTHSLEQDYPSVGQITEKLKDNNVIVIFAVTESAKNIFEKLRDRISNALSFIGVFSSQATIVNILHNITDHITNTLKINHNFDRKFNIEFVSNCEKFNHVNVSCPNVKPGNTISFTAKLELKKCPKNSTKSSYKIFPSGLNKYITIDVDYLCQCECEKAGEKLSPSCSNTGEFQCGICKCPSNKIGASCECDNTANFLYDLSLGSNNCMKDNSTETCSGAGYCNCGQCVCDQKTEAKDKIYGKYCECNDNSCYDDTDVICSDHGTCACGICNCNSGWDGPKCDCTKSEDTCKAPNSNEVCSGNGDCVCGKCQCKTIQGYTFFGDYCETCLNCPQCSNFSSCVDCKLFKQGIYNETQCEENCAHCKIEAIEDVEKIEKDESCSFTDTDGCELKYKYDFNVEDPITLLYVQQEKQNCTKAANLTLWAGIPVLSILVATLIALVLFKLITTLQYRQEYAKFIQERELERNELNPLYKSPTSRVENPLYDGKN